MINEIRSAFKTALDRLNWMDEQTRQAAKDKVCRQTGGQTGGGKRSKGCCLSLFRLMPYMT